MAPPAEKKPKAGSAKPAAAAAGAKKESKPPAAKAPAAAGAKKENKPPAAKAPAAAAAAAGAKKENKPPAAKAPAAAAAAAGAKKESKPPAAKAPAAAAAAGAKKENKPPTAKAPAAATAPKKAPAAKKVTGAKAKPAGKQPLRGKSLTLSAKKKKQATRFVIDCTLPAEDQIFNSTDFEKFLRERIKINGKTGALGNSITIERGDKNSKLIVNANIAFSKRYLKYLTKKYLKKMMLRDTLRVISTARDTYELRYFQIGNDGDDDDEDND